MATMMGMPKMTVFIQVAVIQLTKKPPSKSGQLSVGPASRSCSRVTNKAAAPDSTRSSRKTSTKSQYSSSS